MQTARILRPKGGRTPLQLKNCVSPPNLLLVHDAKTKPLQECVHSNKENRPNNYATPSLDASLAEELTAIKKKLERLRLDRERTEKMLKDKDRVLELQMKELLQRGEFQKELEIEVDRLYRLNQLRSHCRRVSPIRTLREREQGKQDNETQPLDTRVEGAYESVDESPSETRIWTSPDLVAQEQMILC